MKIHFVLQTGIFCIIVLLSLLSCKKQEPERAAVTEVSMENEEASVLEPLVDDIPNAPLLCRALSLPPDTPLTENDTLELACDFSRNGGEGPDNPLLLTLQAWKMSSDIPDYLEIKGSFIIIATPHKGGEPFAHCFYTIDHIPFFYENSDGEKYGTQFFDNYVFPLDDGYYIDASKEYLLLPGPPEAGAYTVNFYLVFEDHSCIWGEPSEIVLYKM